MSSCVSVCARYERSVESGVLGMSVVVTPEGVRRWCVGGVYLEYCFLPYVCVCFLHSMAMGALLCAGYLDSGACSHGLFYLR
eukprot:SAG25_NODE_594_length_6680_cov_64.843489_2_plen_82_part_00